MSKYWHFVGLQIDQCPDTYTFGKIHASYATSDIFTLTELWLVQSCFLMTDLMITFWHILSSLLPDKIQNVFIY